MEKIGGDNGDKTQDKRLLKCAADTTDLQFTNNLNQHCTFVRIKQVISTHYCPLVKLKNKEWHSVENEIVAFHYILNYDVVKIMKN